MKRTTKYILAVLIVVVLIPVAATRNEAMLPLVKGGEFWSELSFSQANRMILDAQNGVGESFVFIYYSREHKLCQEYIPVFRDFAHKTSTHIYGLDAQNSFGGNDTSFTTVDLRGGFPFAFVYNDNTKELTCNSYIESISRLLRLLKAAEIPIPQFDGSDSEPCGCD